jgi:Coenzyme PQQ synthesis protein D (PqqD)
MPDRRVPVQRYTFIFEEMDEESLLYHEGLKKTIYLNETATIIWKLCDSTRTVQDIIDLLNQGYADSGESLDADVTDAIATLAAEGALRFGSAVEEVNGEGAA